MPTPYRDTLALLTDLYQLTMAYGYWKSGRHEDEATFHLTFRKSPFKGAFAIASGQGVLHEILAGFRFADDDLAYLATLRGNDDAPLFAPAFLELLGTLRLTCTIEAVPEGTVVFPHEPLLRVTGPLLQAQLLETLLLNVINFHTLIATKAARICLAAEGDRVMEFGLRRAQGIDGGLGASRAAFVGGCVGTSNVLAGKRYGIPVLGTHAHSWVMVFDSELEAFEAYAAAMPNNCVFLVDTYDTLDGVRRAAQVATRLRARGHELVGVRLDSGDLAWLSIEARKILDAAGFPDASIVASNDLDEHIIHSLKSQGARIDVWGVGTKLATAYDQPALGGVYKLSSLRRPGGAWEPRVKLSEQLIKVSTPGRLQVRRFLRDGKLEGDAIYDEAIGIPPSPTIVDPMDPTRRRRFDAGLEARDLLAPFFGPDGPVGAPEPLSAARDRAHAELATLHEGVKRLTFPHIVPVGLEHDLHALKTRLVLDARGFGEAS